ncbi:MAG: NTF2-like N-terminal transpeptidase domain-containing protein [Anaerolineales bacterium]
MAEKWEHFKERWRYYSKRIMLVAFLLIAVLLGRGIYQAYHLYSDRVTVTPTKAVETYFTALATGDYEEVYGLTAQEDLTDIYGRDVTRGEFMDQLEEVTGGYPLPLEAVESEEIFKTNEARYYRVLLTFSVGGKARQSRLLVEVRREGDAWVVTYPFAIVL